MPQYTYEDSTLLKTTAFWCPNCNHAVRRALPVEPLFTKEEACELIPCGKWWLNQALRRSFISEPIYFLDSRYRRRRMLTATDIRNLRKSRLAQHARKRNPEEPVYE